MKKKFIAILLLFLCLISTGTKSVFATDSKIIINSESAYLIDYNSGTELFSQNENERLPIASMTKLMLLYLIFDSVNNNTLSLTEKITISENAKNMGGSQVFLEENGEYLCSDLVKSIIVSSANDASVAMAERLFGSEENCVEEMNKTCEKLNLKNTLYSNCTGLPKPTQYSCAKDVALLLKEVCCFKEYFNFSNIWLDKISHPSGQETMLTNTNKLIKYYSGCDGGKTGFTNEAGFCLSATAKRGSMRLVGVVINAKTSKERFNDVSNLFNYGFNNYNEVCVLERGEALKEQAEVKGGDKETLNVSVQDSLYLFSEKNKKINYNYKVEFKCLKAPINKGEVVGSVSVYVNDKFYKNINIVSQENIQRKSYKDSIKEIVDKW